MHVGRGAVIGLVAAAFALVGCGSSDGAHPVEESARESESDAEENQAADTSGFPQELLPDEVVPQLEPVVPAADDITLFSPIVRDLVPGADETHCTFSDVILDEPALIHSVEGTQSHFGHHAILYYTTEPQEPHTTLCKNEDMDAMRQLMGGSGGDDASGYIPPENVAMEVPAGAQFVLQHHWINTGTEAADVQSMMVAHRAELTEETIFASAVTVLSTGWQINPGEQVNETTTCTYQEDTDYFMAIGHAHEWASHVGVSVIRAGGASETIIDLPFEPEYATNPPVEDFPLDQPLHIAAGDTLELSCEWENDTDEMIEFPREMCVFFGYAIGGEDRFCMNGEWL